MRHIAALEDEKVPRDNEFKFKERAQTLVAKWHNTFMKQPNGTSEPNGDSAGDQQRDSNTQSPTQAPQSVAPPAAEQKMDVDPANAKTNATPAVAVAEYKTHC